MPGRPEPRRRWEGRGRSGLAEGPGAETRNAAPAEPVPRPREAGRAQAPLDAVPGPARAVVPAEGRVVGPEVTVEARRPAPEAPPRTLPRRDEADGEVEEVQEVAGAPGPPKMPPADAAGAPEDVEETVEDAVPPPGRQAPRVPVAPVGVQEVTVTGPRRLPPPPARAARGKPSTRDAGVRQGVWTGRAVCGRNAPPPARGEPSVGVTP